MMKKTNLIYTLLAALLLAVVAAVFFAPADFEGKVLQQSDMMQGFANGHEASAYEAETGEKAYWTNALFGGMPTFQISPSYSANRMLEWVVKVYTLWLPSPANILFAMMIGFFIMCLCMKMKWPYALFGAIAWGFSTYFIIIIGAGHIWKFLTLAYIPPTIGGIALLYRGRYWGGAALTALFTALQLGSNHPQMTYYFLFVVGAMMIAWFVTAWREKQLRRWGIATACLVGAGGLGLCANLASIYMSYKYSKETIRGKSTELAVEGQGQAEGLDFDYITAWSYGRDETMTLLIPNIKGGATGKPVEGAMKGLPMTDHEALKDLQLSQEEQMMLYDGMTSGSQSRFMEYFGDQPMTNGPVYVGALVLVLAILAMFVVDGKFMGPMKWALFGVSILAILLAWGHNFETMQRFFIDNVPFYNKFRTPSSMLVVVEFTIPLLAVMAIMRMVEMPDFMARYRTVFYAVFGVIGALCLIGWVFPGFFGSPWSQAETEFLNQHSYAGFMQSYIQEAASQGYDTSGLQAYAASLADVPYSQDPVFAPLIERIEQARLGVISADSGRSLIFIMLGFGVCFVYLNGMYRNKPVVVCCLAGVVLIDLFSVNKRYLNNDSFIAPVSEEVFVPTRADLEILKDKDPNYRVMDYSGFGNARSSYFHKTVGGYHAAKLTRYNDLISNPVFAANPDVVNMLNAKYFIYPSRNPETGESVTVAELNPDAFGNAWLVDEVRYVDSPDSEMAALGEVPLRTVAVADVQFRDVLGTGKPVSEGDYIRETSYAPGKLDYEVQSKNGGVAVFSEIYFPWGWEATVDGQPVEIGRVDYVLRAIQVPSGKHTVHFEFNPKGLKATNTLGVISVSLIYLLCLIALVYEVPYLRRKISKVARH